MSLSAAMWLNDVFLMIFGQQRRSTAQRNKIYEALDTHMILIRQKVENRQSYSLNVLFLQSLPATAAA